MRKILTQKWMKSCVMFAAASLFTLTSCAPVDRPGARTPHVPVAKSPKTLLKGVNQGHEAILRIPLGEDVLVPRAVGYGALPDVHVGPYELRSETLASALQLLLADFDIALAFETELGLTERITVANLQGYLPKVVARICGLANLYCAYEDGLLTVKETETFVVDLPPITDQAGFDQIATGLEVILGETPVVDTTTRVMVYNASHRTQRYVHKYFQKLRKSTALIVYETHVWEVSLDNENRTGINWTAMLTGSNFDLNITLPGAAPSGAAAPISITPSFTGSKELTTSSVLEFISQYGAVKTVSQPQLTVLSGATASMNISRSENYVSEVTRTTDDAGNSTFSATTDTLDTGLTLAINSSWDRSTVYGSLDITLNELLNIETFSPNPDLTLQLPETTTRSLNTQIRVRPGDAVLIGGLVQERDNFNGSGPGFMKPIFETARAAKTTNIELVFLLRPRVIAFVSPEDAMSHNMKAQKKLPVQTGAISYDDLLRQSADATEKPVLNMGGISTEALQPSTRQALPIAPSTFKGGM